MPPLSGFIGKVLILGSAGGGVQAAWLYTLILVSGLVVLVALSRAGSTLFWRNDGAPAAGEPLDPLRTLAAMALLACSPAMVVLAAPLLDYLDATVAQLLDHASYIDAVLSLQTVTSGGDA